MKIFKKLILIISISLLFTACNGADSELEKDKHEKEIEIEEIEENIQP